MFLVLNLNAAKIQEGLAQLWWAKRICLGGLAFLLADILLSDDVMSPDVYGYLAYDIDASTWAQGFVASSGIILLSFYVNGRWPLGTSFMRLVGWSTLSFLHLTLSLSSLFAPQGIHLVIFGMLFFFDRAISFARVSLTELRRRKARRDGRTTE